MDIENRQEHGESEPTDAVGIVVRSGLRGQRSPRTVAFVWGGKAPAVPSLPYGRWKTQVKTAA